MKSFLVPVSASETGGIFGSFTQRVEVLAGVPVEGNLSTQRAEGVPKGAPVVVLCWKNGDARTTSSASWPGFDAPTARELAAALLMAADEVDRCAREKA